MNPGNFGWLCTVSPSLSPFITPTAHQLAPRSPRVMAELLSRASTLEMRIKTSHSVSSASGGESHWHQRAYFPHTGVCFPLRWSPVLRLQQSFSLELSSDMRVKLRVNCSLPFKFLQIVTICKAHQIRLNALVMSKDFHSSHTSGPFVMLPGRRGCSWPIVTTRRIQVSYTVDPNAWVIV